MNPLLKNNGQAQSAPDPQQMRAELQRAVDQVKADPAGFLSKLGVNVPSGMNDPQTIMNHLMQSRQVPQSRYSQVMRMFGKR